jgi:hypothetical protein
LFINHAWFVNICFGNFSVLWRWWQLWLLVMGGSPSIDPYQDYINYLHDIVIYKLQQRLDEALASPNRPADNQCYPCATCTCECHAKMRVWSPLPSPPPPPPGYYMPSRSPQAPAPCSITSSRTTSFRM